MPHRFAATRFVLVEPSHPGNVGSAARALKTMGFGRLTLVAPRVADAHRDPVAQAMASGADDVLAATEVVGTLDEALAGARWSLALSARVREFGPPAGVPRDAAAAARGHAGNGDIALVFGNERTGLSNVEVERCSAIVHIPSNPAYSSLNLAQAVQLMAYELRLAFTESVPQAPMATLASADEVERLFDHLQRGLIAVDYLDPANPKKLMTRLRGLFARAGLRSEEVHLLHGVAKQMLRAGQAATRAEQAGASGTGPSD